MIPGFPLKKTPLAADIIMMPDNALAAAAAPFFSYFLPIVLPVLHVL